MTDETALRRWYAEDLRLRAPILNHLSIADAFATVPRERFVGPPPWRLLSDRMSQVPFDTPDGALGWLHHDVLVVIDPTRALNNGLPSLWARSFDQLDLRRGQKVMQVGAGTGYYAAILAEVVGPEGRVVAVEVDAALAARARESLAPWRNVEVVAADGCTYDPGEVDIIIVCAGATHPAPLWLDRLAPRGQLLMPLTTDERWGFLLRATRGGGRDTDRIALPKVRRGDGFDATSIGRVGIYPCVGGRDDAAAKRLDAALTEIGRASWFAPVPISALHRGAPSGEEKVWYYGPGFWLERAL